MQLTDGEHLQKTILAAPIGICVLNAETLVAEAVNAKFLEVAGKPYEAIHGRFYWEAFAEVRTNYEVALAGVVETGEAYHADEVELMLIRHGRKERVFVNFVYAPIKNDAGKVTKVAVWVMENTRQVIARKAISASEKRFRALVTATSDVIYAVSADWEVMHELDGRGFLKDTDKPITGWRARNVYPEDLEMVNAAIKEAIDGKKIFQLEHRVLRADGSPGWTFSRAVPIFDKEGNIIEWFGTASDITQRKQIEEALQEVKQQADQQKRIYEAITSGTPDLMYVWDLDYRFTYANSALLTMWGKNWETAIGKRLIDNGYEPWHAEMHEREIDSIIATKQPVRGEVSFPHAVLGRRVYDYILVPVFNEQGEVEAVAGTTRDVSDRKQIEETLAHTTEELQAINEEMLATNEEQAASNEELTTTNQQLAIVNEELLQARKKIEESEITLRLAIDAANFGTWFIHSETREFITDARLKELFGYYPDEPLSIEQALAQITDDYRGFVTTKLENAIYNNGDYDVTYSVIGLHDNRLRWLRAIGNLKADPSGAFSAFTGVVMDVTEQRLDEQRKNDFIGMVSHELKTPLTSLTAIVQLAQSKLKNSEDPFLGGAMEKANLQVKRMSNMINGFLNVSRLESAKLLIDKKEFNLDKLIDEAVKENAVTTSSHIINFEPGKHIMVNADQDKISSVITNLISNAVKYSPKGTTVEINCEIIDNKVQVCIKDEGIGLKPQDKSKVFDRYFRVESSNTQHISGFGIGLYLSAEIIHRHHGEIWVESEPGEGSTFYFSLPMN